MGLLKKVKKAVKKTVKAVTDNPLEALVVGPGAAIAGATLKGGSSLLGGLAPKQEAYKDGSLSPEQLAANRPSWLSNMPTQGYGQQFAPKAGFDNPLFARLFGQQQMGQLQQQLGAGSWNPPQQGQQQMPTQFGMQPPAWAQAPQMGMAQPKPLYSPSPFTTQIQPPQAGNFFNPFGS